LLFFLAAGPVRGFGVTLSIGVLASMFTTLVLTRALLEITAARRTVRARPRLTGLADIGAVRRWLVARRPNLMRHRRRWLALSAVAVLVSLAGIGVRGLDLGLEFTGGRTVEYATAQTVDVDEARSVVADAGLPRAVVQTTDNGIAVRAAGMSDNVKADVRAALAQLGGDADAVRDEFIGPSLSGELRGKALIALGVALAAQLLYLAVRFQWRFSAAAVLAMAHDVVILLGLFAWLGKPIDGVFLAALLTVIGYSVNDSVVVFDRIRELLRSRRKEPLATVANDACLQTVPRTVNTGMGALFILAALTLLGGDSLTDFALALLVGILLGTWSSVFTATPLAIVFGRSRRSRRRRQAGGSSAAGSAGQPIRRAPSTAL
jgi:SecD/SecF fusion protein